MTQPATTDLPAVREISLRPYFGRLFVAKTPSDYEKAHESLFLEPDILKCNQGGRFSGGCGKDGMWTYLVGAREPAFLVHELAHVALHVFERYGMDPTECNGNAFYYLLSQLFADAKARK